MTHGLLAAALGLGVMEAASASLMSSMIKQVSKAMAKDAAKDVVIDQATKVISNRSQEPAPARASSHSVEPVAQKTRPVSASGSTVQRQQAQRKAPARKARLPGDDLSPEMRANWMKVLSFYTKEANKHLPQEELPGLIRSDRMSVGPGVVWNHHKTMLDYDARKFTPKVRSAASRALNEQHKMNVCGDRDFLDTLKKGLTYRIIYTGRDGGPIATLNYDRKVCGI